MRDKRMGDHVFICYSRKDEDFVLKLATNLKRQGVPVWLDQWDIDSGANWNRTIEKALDECNRLLIILSPSSVESDEVQSEWLEVLDLKKVVVPILYQTCRMPFRLKPIQYIDFTSRSPDDIAALNDVLVALGKTKSTLSRPKEISVTKEEHSVPSSSAFDPAKAWHKKGADLSEQGKHDEAPRAYEKAMELDPKKTKSTLEKEIEAKAWYNRGWDLAAHGIFDEAIKAYDMAIELDPQHAKAWKNKGNVFYDQEKYDEAIKAYDKAIEINPQDPYIWYNKGTALRILGYEDEADAAFVKAKALGYKS
jgi:tetratricopeptide (TPR) repeat protein